MSTSSEKSLKLTSNTIQGKGTPEPSPEHRHEGHCVCRDTLKDHASKVKSAGKRVSFDIISGKYGSSECQVLAKISSLGVFVMEQPTSVYLSKYYNNLTVCIETDKKPTI